MAGTSVASVFNIDRFWEEKEFIWNTTEKDPNPGQMFSTGCFDPNKVRFIDSDPWKAQIAAFTVIAH